MSSLTLEQPRRTTLLFHPSNIPLAPPAPWVTSPLRRALDFCVAASALLFCSPLFLIAAVAVRCSSSGPVLFRQQRMGRNGKKFTVYKFRSMYVCPQYSSPITVRGDARVTPVGAILRRFKLDELPQLWNVLKGDMSLVGPRPKLPHHGGLHLTACPGLTGAATLAFRDEEELLAAIPEEELDEIYEKYVKPAKARLDFEYMRNATFTSDLAILWKTAVSCVCPWTSARFFSEEYHERPILRRYCHISLRPGGDVKTEEMTRAQARKEPV